MQLQTLLQDSLQGFGVQLIRGYLRINRRQGLRTLPPSLLPTYSSSTCSGADFASVQYLILNLQCRASHPKMNLCITSQNESVHHIRSKECLQWHVLASPMYTSCVPPQLVPTYQVLPLALIKPYHLTSKQPMFVTHTCHFTCLQVAASHG